MQSACRRGKQEGTYVLWEGHGRGEHAIGLFGGLHDRGIGSEELEHDDTEAAVRGENRGGEKCQDGYSGSGTSSRDSMSESYVSL